MIKQKKCINCDYPLSGQQEKYCCIACKNSFNKHKRRSINTDIKAINNTANEICEQFECLKDSMEGTIEHFNEFKRKLMLLEEKLNNSNNERNKK